MSGTQPIPLSIQKEKVILGDRGKFFSSKSLYLYSTLFYYRKKHGDAEYL